MFYRMIDLGSPLCHPPRPDPSDYVRSYRSGTAGEGSGDVGGQVVGQGQPVRWVREAEVPTRA